MKGRKHKLKVRLRAFHIWQLLGYSPWKSEWTVPQDNVRAEGNVKGFYKGAFDSIPFLNDDGKRTFIHLLLRPGYMIRDYIKGEHDQYLAPLTSLIIFYAFFSLVSSIAHPDFEDKKADTVAAADSISGNKVQITLSLDDGDTVSVSGEDQNVKLKKFLEYVDKVDLLMTLNQHPEAIDTPGKASLAAFEDALRSQGFQYFVGVFLLLWPAMRMSLRKHSMGLAASATTAAYVLCQFSFFMLFVLILSFGKNNEIGTLFMGLLIMIDYHQLLGIGFKKSFWLTVKTGFWFAFLIFLLIMLATGILSIWMAL